MGNSSVQLFFQVDNIVGCRLILLAYFQVNIVCIAGYIYLYIRRRNITVIDPDNTAAEVTFTVTSVPDHGLLSLNGVGLNVSDTFTQADINANLLAYDHDDEELTDDAFTASFTDGTSAPAPLDFDIKVPSRIQAGDSLDISGTLPIAGKCRLAAEYPCSEP